VMPSYSNYFELTTATKSLNTAISYMGGALMALFAGSLVDWRGRKECVFWSAVITMVGGIIQGAAQNIGMFIAGRFIVGFGLGLAQVSTPTLVAETAPVEWRGFALGLYYAFWGVGTLIASGVCYGVSTSTLQRKRILTRRRPKTCLRHGHGASLPCSRRAPLSCA
jgi:MFS family permease